MRFTISVICMRALLGADSQINPAPSLWLHAPSLLTHTCARELATNLKASRHFDILCKTRC